MGQTKEKHGLHYFFSSGTLKEVALQMATQCSISEGFTIMEAARILRDSITDLMKDVFELNT